MTDHDRLTRRDFLAASALGALGLPRAAGALASDAAAAPGLLYVGTYTKGGRREGIHLVRLDPRTGALRLTGSVDAGDNPSFLALHPGGRVLYAVNEVTELDGEATGAVSAFAIARDTGALTRLNAQPSRGGAPCYVSVARNGRAVLVANYVGGNVALLPTVKDGALAPAIDVEQHRGAGPNASRQRSAHAHCIVPDPSGRWALAADLGIDRVLVYRLDGAKGLTPHGDARMRAGAGPRHLVFHPTLPLVFVANELDSTVSTLRFRRDTGALAPLATQSTLPAGWSGASHVADIHTDAAGRTLYVSNRGHDSIAVYSVARRTGALVLEQVVSTEGHWPRNFGLDPSGRWLLVANERSGSIVVFARNRENGRLTPTAERLAVADPVCLRFALRASPIAT